MLKPNEYITLLNNMNEDMRNVFLAIQNKLNIKSKKETIDIVFCCTNNNNLEKIINKIKGNLFGR